MLFDLCFLLSSSQTQGSNTIHYNQTLVGLVVASFVVLVGVDTIDKGKKNNKFTILQEEAIHPFMVGGG